MPLNLTTLEPREAPVYAEVVGLPHAFYAPEWDFIRAEVVRTAARFVWLGGELPAQPAVTPLVHTTWGTMPNEALLPNRVRIWVGADAPSHTLGIGVHFNPVNGRPIGGSFSLNLDLIRRTGTDLGTVIRHEVGHAFQLGHIDTPNALMSQFLPANTVRDFTDADRAEAARFGWAITPSPQPLTPQPPVTLEWTFPNGATGGGVFDADTATRLLEAAANPDPERLAEGWVYPTYHTPDQLHAAGCSCCATALIPVG
jgi:hypothetical protein